MEIVRILGVDPSLRNTGLAVVCYNTEKNLLDSGAFWVEGCKTITNPQKFKGTSAILNMLDLMDETSRSEVYKNLDAVLVESPPIMFNKEWSQGTMSSIAHISGGAAVVFGLEKCHLFRPNEWNKCRKKEVTHNKTEAFLGEIDGWSFEKKPKNKKMLEHILDAASMAMWFLRANYLED